MSHAQRGPLAAFAALALVSATTLGMHMASADNDVEVAHGYGEILIQQRAVDGAAPMFSGQRDLLGGRFPGQALPPVGPSSAGAAAQAEAREGGGSTSQPRVRDREQGPAASSKGRDAGGREGFAPTHPGVPVEIIGGDDGGPRSEQQPGGPTPGDSDDSAGGPKNPGKGPGHPTTRPDTGEILPPPAVPTPPPVPEPSPEAAPADGPRQFDRPRGHDRGRDQSRKGHAKTQRGPGAAHGKAHGKSRGSGKKMRRGSGRGAR